MPACRIIAGLDKMKQMVVGPMADFDDRAAFGVPTEAVRVARAFGEIWNSRVRGCMRHIAQLKSYRLPLFD